MLNFKEPFFCRTVKYHFVSSNDARKIRKIALVGDLHISPIVSEKQSEMIMRVLKLERPEVIIFQGDLVDSPDFLLNHDTKQRLARSIQNCTKIAPVIGVVGNHDQFRQSKGRNRKHETITEFKERFVPEAIEELRKVFKENDGRLLLDEWTRVAGIDFFGFYEDAECSFYGNGEKARLDAVRRKIAKLAKTGTFKKSGVTNWFLGHAPIEELTLMDELKVFSVFSFGHTHGGCVPIGLDILLDTFGLTGGIISPVKRLFPIDWMRGKKELNNNQRVIINSGMVATHFSAPRPLQYLNCLKRAEITIIEIELN